MPNPIPVPEHYKRSGSIAVIIPNLFDSRHAPSSPALVAEPDQ